MRKTKRKSIQSRHGQPIRYKNGSVSILLSTRPLYSDKLNKADVVHIVIDKSSHPVWISRLNTK